MAVGSSEKTEHIVRLLPEGRLCIPKAIRDSLGLAPGDVLEIIEEGQKVILRPRRHNVDI